MSSTAEKIRTKAQDEALRVIEKMDPEHIASFSDLCRKLTECTLHAKRVQEQVRRQFEVKF